MTTQFHSDFHRIRRALAAGVMALACARSLATTFTNDTTIGVSNTNYDGSAIVVTNCTVKVDGPHAFASVLVAAGGVLTHSFSPGGTISNLLFVCKRIPGPERQQRGHFAQFQCHHGHRFSDRFQRSN